MSVGRIIPGSVRESSAVEPLTADHEAVGSIPALKRVCSMKMNIFSDWPHDRFVCTETKHLPVSRIFNTIAAIVTRPCMLHLIENGSLFMSFKLPK